MVFIKASSNPSKESANYKYSSNVDSQIQLLIVMKSKYHRYMTLLYTNLSSEEFLYISPKLTLAPNSLTLLYMSAADQDLIHREATIQLMRTCYIVLHYWPKNRLVIWEHYK